MWTKSRASIAVGAAGLAVAAGNRRRGRRSKAARRAEGGKGREGERTEEELRSNFDQMGLLFALNHGVVTTPLAVATSLLGPEVANVGNGTLYVFSLLSSLLLGAPIVGSYGPKNGLLLGMLLYCVYVGCFALALSMEPGASAQGAVFLAGSAAGGVAAGVLWTAQGSYFSSTATEIAKLSGQTREQATAGLAGTFASVYLLLEVASKVGFSWLQNLDVQVPVIACAYFLVGGGATAMMTRILDFEVPGSSGKPMDKLLAASSLWSDPVIWLLAPCNLAFGFSAAYMNGFVNGTYATQELGTSFVALLGAVTALTAAALSKAYGGLSAEAGKGPVILIGAASFLCIPLLTSGGCAGWGWGIMVLYLLQGSGRAVYESTNRALFSDFFPGTQTEGAFANCMLQSSLAFAVCFFLQASVDPRDLGVFVTGLAALTGPGYYLAKQLRDGQEAGEA